MKGSETQLLGLMEGADKRYVIPVYQRKYDWKVENCRQLYADLEKVIRDGRSHHFFGSIVSQIVPDGSKTSEASLISTSLNGVALANEADWPRMAEFMATWSRKFLNVFVPVLKERSSGR